MIASTTYPKPGAFDVVMIHRPLSRLRVDQVLAQQQAGALVIVDEDDDLTRLHETGSEEALLAMMVHSAQRNHALSIASADAMTTTTPKLQAVYGEVARRTFVTPNMLPRWVQSVKPIRRDDRVRVGWMGITKTHSVDLEWLRPAAREALAGAVFSTVGDRATIRALGGLAGIPREVHGWEEDPGTLYRRMALVDVGIVPLAPTEFNAAKSWLKALEYQTLGRPVVATDLPEQRALIRHGETGFLASTPQEFAHYVQQLVRDRDLREQMGAAAKSHTATLAIEDRIGVWEEAINAIWQEAEAPQTQADHGQSGETADPEGARRAARRTRRAKLARAAT